MILTQARVSGLEATQLYLLSTHSGKENGAAPCLFYVIVYQYYKALPASIA